MMSNQIKPVSDTLFAVGKVKRPSTLVNDVQRVVEGRIDAGHQTTVIDFAEFMRGYGLKFNGTYMRYPANSTTIVFFSKMLKVMKTCLTNATIMLYVTDESIYDIKQLYGTTFDVSTTDGDFTVTAAEERFDLKNDLENICGAIWHNNELMPVWKYPSVAHRMVSQKQETVVSEQKEEIENVLVQHPDVVETVEETETTPQEIPSVSSQSTGNNAGGSYTQNKSVIEEAEATAVGVASSPIMPDKPEESKKQPVAEIPVYEPKPLEPAAKDTVPTVSSAPIYVPKTVEQIQAERASKAAEEAKRAAAPKPIPKPDIIAKASSMLSFGTPTPEPVEVKTAVWGGVKIIAYQVRMSTTEMMSRSTGFDIIWFKKGYNPDVVAPVLQTNRYRLFQSNTPKFDGAFLIVRELIVDSGEDSRQTIVMREPGKGERKIPEIIIDGMIHS